jgi:predicted subunit of tRNA(5-methylaminomethyl-2-thiouridylate) methyltransferase
MAPCSTFRSIPSTRASSATRAFSRPATRLRSWVSAAAAVSRATPTRRLRASDCMRALERLATSASRPAISDSKCRRRARVPVIVIRPVEAPLAMAVLVVGDAAIAELPAAVFVFDTKDVTGTNAGDFDVFRRMLTRRSIVPSVAGRSCADESP